MLGETMSINKLFAVLHCQPTRPNRLRGEARNGRRAIYVDRSRRPDGDLRDKPGYAAASGCTKGAPWGTSRCIGPDGSPVGGAQQRRPSPYLVSQEEKPSKSARGAGPPGTRKARRGRRRKGADVTARGNQGHVQNPTALKKEPAEREGRRRRAGGATSRQSRSLM